MLAAAVLVIFLREVPLHTTIDRADVIAESLEIDGSSVVALTTAELAIINEEQLAAVAGRPVTEPE